MEIIFVTIITYVQAIMLTINIKQVLCSIWFTYTSLQHSTQLTVHLYRA